MIGICKKKKLLFNFFYYDNFYYSFFVNIYIKIFAQIAN